MESQNDGDVPPAAAEQTAPAPRPKRLRNVVQRLARQGVISEFKDHLRWENYNFAEGKWETITVYVPSLEHNVEFKRKQPAMPHRARQHFEAARVPSLPAPAGMLRERPQSDFVLLETVSQDLDALLVAAASLDDNGFLRNCNSAGTEDAENQNVVAFVMPQMLWSAAKRRIEFRNDYHHVYLFPCRLTDRLDVTLLGCSCDDFSDATVHIHRTLQRGSAIALTELAALSMFYSRRHATGVVTERRPCAHMLVLLLTIDALPEVRMLGAVHQLDRVPVLPRLRELRWNGPPLPAVRLPYGHAPDVQTRVFSVQDGQLRAIVKRMPHSSSCARLPGIDRCPTSKICNHRRLAEGANEDLAEPAPPEQETTPDEHARLVELQAGSPIDLTKRRCSYLTIPLSPHAAIARRQIQDQVPDVFVAEEPEDGSPYALCAGTSSRHVWSDEVVSCPKYLVDMGSLRKVECRSRRCTVCGFVLPFDGQSVAVFNPGSGSGALYKYEVLFDYIHSMRNTVMPFDTFHRIRLACYDLNDKMTADLARLWSTAIFQRDVFRFVASMRLPFENAFRCRTCEQSGVQFVTLDGTAIGIRKLMVKSDPLAAAPGPPKPTMDSTDGRLFMCGQGALKIRALLVGLVTNGGSYDEFRSVLMWLHQASGRLPRLQSLLRLLTFVIVRGPDDSVTIMPLYRELVKALAALSPVQALMPRNAADLYRTWRQAPPAGRADALQDLLVDSPVLELLLHPVVDAVLPVLDHVADMVSSYFAAAEAIEPLPVVNEPVDFWDGFVSAAGRIVRHAPQYEIDARSLQEVYDGDTGCNKDGTRHPSLTPGVMTCYCQHGVCLAVAMMNSVESPKTAFRFLLALFEKMPRYIVYDNACHLATYALSREPHLFRHSVIACDALHYRTHTGCCAAFNSKRHIAAMPLNTMRNEQENSVLQRIRPFVQYMTQHNFMFMLRLFFALRNVLDIKHAWF